MCQDSFISYGAVRKLIKNADTAARGDVDAASAIRALGYLVGGAGSGTGHLAAVEDLFLSGTVYRMRGELAARRQPDDVTAAIGDFLAAVAACPASHLRLLDASLLPLLPAWMAPPGAASAAAAGPSGGGFVEAAYFLSLSEVAAGSMRTDAFFEGLMRAVAHPAALGALQQQAAAGGGSGGGGAQSQSAPGEGAAANGGALANGGAKPLPAAGSLSASGAPPGAAASPRLSGPGDGGTVHDFTSIPLESVLHSIKCLATSPNMGRRLATPGTPSYVVLRILDVIVSSQQHHAAGTIGRAAWLARATAATQTLLRLASCGEVLPALRAAGAISALRVLALEAEDPRVTEPARAALLHLGDGGHVGCTSRAAVAAFRTMYGEGDVALAGLEPEFDGRTLSSDWAHMITCCRNLVVVLTEHLLASTEHLREMEFAVGAGVHVVLVVPEGSRWPDAQGNKAHRVSFTSEGDLPTQSSPQRTRQQSLQGGLDEASGRGGGAGGGGGHGGGGGLDPDPDGDAPQLPWPWCRLFDGSGDGEDEELQRYPRALSVGPGGGLGGTRETASGSAVRLSSSNASPPLTGGILASHASRRATARQRSSINRHAALQLQQQQQYFMVQQQWMTEYMQQQQQPAAGQEAAAAGGDGAGAGPAAAVAGTASAGAGDAAVLSQLLALQLEMVRYEMRQAVQAGATAAANAGGGGGGGGGGQQGGRVSALAMFDAAGADDDPGGGRVASPSALIASVTSPATAQAALLMAGRGRQYGGGGGAGGPGAPAALMRGSSTTAIVAAAAATAAASNKGLGMNTLPPLMGQLANSSGSGTLSPPTAAKMVERTDGQPLRKAQQQMLLQQQQQVVGRH
ncbi:hypothetical protein GPECTOR_127g531 [Gonium pectorale]|uniref:TIR domain-containing protein n=1 Tax=Gonium pectorale TaxID=33097 RepID=A0A150FYG1_GONPE|nr:hypothetical protein GPECTOR_127g531 [Gonium pectorale]|eukprot:KXZ42653.1 hypothetical protein GPECTOR_127g531 [Gonium pectorale]